MSLPAVRALKRSRPGIHLTVSCRANLAPMWEAQEEVDAVIPFAKSLNPLQVGKLLRSHGPFDAGLLLPNSFRSALELRLGGVKPLTGYSRYQRGILLGTAVTEEASPAGKEHHVHRYLQLVAAIGVPIEPLEEMLAIPLAPTSRTVSRCRVWERQTIPDRAICRSGGDTPRPSPRKNDPRRHFRKPGRTGDRGGPRGTARRTARQSSGRNLPSWSR